MMSFAKSKKLSRGFTLIEITVVIAIIGILVSILVLNFEESRKRARDNVRKSDLKSLQLALEVYKAQNSRYPAMGCSVPTGTGGHAWAGPGPMSGSPNSWGGYACANYAPGLAPDFIPQLPVDPSLQSIVDSGIIYTTDTNGTGYKVLMGNETIKVNSYQDEYARCPASCGVGSNCQPVGPPDSVYAVYSAGAQCW